MDWSIFQVSYTKDEERSRGRTLCFVRLIIAGRVPGFKPISLAVKNSPLSDFSGTEHCLDLGDCPDSIHA